MPRYNKRLNYSKRKIVKRKSTISNVLSHLSRFGKKTLERTKTMLSPIFTFPSRKETLKKEEKRFKRKKLKPNFSKPSSIVEGKITITSSMNAFVIVEALKEDIFIPRDKIAKALEGDQVRVRIKRERDKKPGKNLEGEVIKILKRKNKEFVGIFKKNPLKSYGFVFVNAPKIHVDIYIPQGNQKQANDRDRVIVDLVDWLDHAPNPTGRITEVLGPFGDHEVEIHSILAQYKLPAAFPKEIEQEAQEIRKKIPLKEITQRKDLRTIKTFTIDPADAKDFDDAVSLEFLENERFRVGVHIADVSYYIKEDSLLDKEAYKRATSVYLVDRVIPMLPEVLSNELCSLRPNEDKLCFSALFEMDASARLFGLWFGKTIIRSKKRFSYEQAQEIIEKRGREEFSKEILILNKLAKELRRKRFLNGSINFDSTEVKFKLNEQSHPIEIYKKQSKEAHQMIEEWMLLTNKKVSEFISLDKNRKPLNRTYIYRIHDEPDLEKLTLLKAFIKPLGYEINLKDKQALSQSINKLLKEIKGTPEQNAVELLIMRAMSKARYSTKNISHYGLAFKYYTHFTSPIRRYPDIIAHRLLEHYLKRGNLVSSVTYEKKMEHCSSQERLAMEAERESIKYMQVKYMEGFIGKTFQGAISGVTEWGLFVEISLIGAEGMIRIKDLKDDMYIFNKQTHHLVGKQHKQIYKLGMKIEVLLQEANLEKRQLTFKLIKAIA